MKRDAPATQRNRRPILDVLRSLTQEGTQEGAQEAHGRAPWSWRWPAAPRAARRVLRRRAAGRRLAAHRTGDPASLPSIEAWRAEAALPNLRPPLVLDAAADAWPVTRADLVVSINMIHIAPWSACEGLMRGAARVVPGGGALFLYGPFRIGGALPAPSNVAFDASLRARDPAWGVRALEEVTALCAAQGLVREAVVAMPANNHSIVFRR